MLGVMTSDQYENPNPEFQFMARQMGFKTQWELDSECEWIVVPNHEHWDAHPAVRPFIERLEHRGARLIEEQDLFKAYDSGGSELRVRNYQADPDNGVKAIFLGDQEVWRAEPEPTMPDTYGEF